MVYLLCEVRYTPQKSARIARYSTEPERYTMCHMKQLAQQIVNSLENIERSDMYDYEQLEELYEVWKLASKLTTAINAQRTSLIEAAEATA